MLFHSPEKTWIGSVAASYKSKEGFVWDFWFQLFEDDYGKRSCEFSGRWPSWNDPKQHGRYSGIILPWMYTKDDSYLPVVWSSLSHYNVEYWNDYPEITKIEQPQPEKPEVKRDFKLLHFPKEKEEETPTASA